MLRDLAFPLARFRLASGERRRIAMLGGITDLELELGLEVRTCCLCSTGVSEFGYMYLDATGVLLYITIFPYLLL